MQVNYIYMSRWGYHSMHTNVYEWLCRVKRYRIILHRNMRRHLWLDRLLY